MRTYRHALLLGSFLLFLPASRAMAQDEPVHDADINVIHFEPLKYPPLAWQTRSVGFVVIRAKLDKQGKVVDAAAISGNPILIPDSLQNIKQWRFQPNKQGAVVLIHNLRVLPADCAEDNQQFFTFELRNFVTGSACAIHLHTSSR